MSPPIEDTSGPDEPTSPKAGGALPAGISSAPPPPGPVPPAGAVSADAIEASAPAPVRTIIWCDRDQGELISALVERCPLQLIGVGCPSGAATAELADRMHAARLPDLRQAILTETYDLMLLCRETDLTREERTAALNRCGAVISLEPLEGLVSERGSAAHDAARQRAHLVPALRFGAAFRFVRDIREEFGAVRSVTVAMRGRRMHGSLLARLIDAIDMVEYLCGPVQQVDAAMSGQTSNQPETLRDMHGHITANARFSQNCCASLSVSDDAGVWQRGITVLGEGGCIRVTDTDLYWHDQGGKCIDESSVAGLTGLNAEDLPMALIADQITLIMEAVRTGASGREPHPTNRLMVVAEAIRLSIRTGQCESPRKIEELMRLS